MKTAILALQKRISQTLYLCSEMILDMRLMDFLSNKAMVKEMLKQNFIPYCWYSQPAVVTQIKLLWFLRVRELNFNPYITVINLRNNLK